ncbi:MAG: RNA polymerase sigma factor SigM [Actinomycetota bacterium]
MAAPYADLPDAELLARHVAGEAEAFGALVHRHRQRLWAVALRTLGDPEEAADAVQDGLLAALRGAAAFRGESAVTTWLHRIVVNACLDRVRRRRPTDPLPDAESPHRAALADPADPVAARETALDVAAALAALPVEQRAALVLVDMAGLPVEEAAQVLGCPVGTVKSRCARGRARLAPLLGHLRNHPPAPDVPSPPAPDVPSSPTTPTPEGGANPP